MRGGASNDMSSSCSQGGPRSISGHQPNTNAGPSSPQTAWQFQSAVVKKEPIDSDVRNDSGVASGSDFTSSSPGSDQSEHFNGSYSPVSASTSSTVCSSLAASTSSGVYLPFSASASSNAYSPFAASTSSGTYSPFSASTTSRAYSSFSESTASTTNEPSSFMRRPYARPVPIGYTANSYRVTPPTPPNSEPDLSPKSSISKMSENENLPSTSGENLLGGQNNSGEDPLKKLQATFEQNSLGELCDDDTKSESDESNESYEQAIRKPKVNSNGKIKTFKCKQCKFVAYTKEQFWEHTRVHMKPDKILKCPICPFVTEYKHHLEYHVHNHKGAKPFKCSQCSYACVNKSMLNSHLKSHSNIYQYSCADCNYSTKYCHSLKLHLRKYVHQPAVVLNPDGTPNPLPIIDVYGTRRGPKIKPTTSKQPEVSPKPEQLLQYPFNQLLQPIQFPYHALQFLPGNSTGTVPNPLFFHNLERFARERLTSIFSSEQRSSNLSEQQSPNHSEQRSPNDYEPGTLAGVLDLSKPEEPSPKKRRRESSCKHSSDENSSEEEDDETTTTMFSNVEVVENKEQEETSSEKAEPAPNDTKKNKYNCPYCEIEFKEEILYTIHMGYHGFNNPFTCNKCGEEYNDKVNFYLHIGRKAHY
ncbi:protein hunchback [Diorhabda carinulata]|uniref:protein hunchback n=1 Tax=Diorhabda carinulata TaxID=1163345 RepID=UPI0025A02299|nr:protein hunchback [Diorhabda carinulata]XP_057663046.1 protein hunchback [Diorhabda carinulata]XP_057663053.1 protein hunchback [Diorhabda carinulata]